MAETVYLLLGSNLGDRARHLGVAREALSGVEGLEITAISPIYQSEAVDMDEDAPLFLNQVVKGDFQYTPSELLAEIEEIERVQGRSDKGKLLPRTIDIDILLFGERVIKTHDLTVPHKKLTNRPFAIVPLLAIDPETINPATKKPLANSLSKKAAGQVELFEDHVSRNV